MINLYFNERAKNLGAKWNGSEWVAPELAKEELEKLKQTYFSNLIAIEVESSDFNIKDGTLGASYAHFAGYAVAKVLGRDDKATLINDVAIIAGGFGGGGSRKNYYCETRENTKVRMYVSEEALNRFKDICNRSKDEESHFDNKYKVTILNQESKSDDLEKEAINLIKRMEKIRSKLGNEAFESLLIKHRGH